METQPLLQNTQSSGYAFIYIWNKKDSFNNSPVAKTGHTSIQVFSHSGHENIYIDFYGNKFIDNYQTTINIIGLPDETFKLELKNVHELYENFTILKMDVANKKTRWSRCGSGFFRDAQDKINCSGVVLESLWLGMNKESLFAKNLNEFHASGEMNLTHYRANFIWQTPIATYKNSAGKRNVILFLCIIMPIVIFLGSLAIYLGYNLASKESQENILLKYLYGIGVFILLTCVIFCSGKIAGSILACLDTAKHFVVTTPEDISFLLNYLSRRLLDLNDFKVKKITKTKEVIEINNLPEFSIIEESVNNSV